MIHNYSIVSGKILLRSLLATDIEDLRLLRNRDDIRKWFSYSEILTKEDQEKWFQKYTLLENDMMFVAEEVGSSGKCIGAAALYNIDYKIKSAEFGRIMVDKQASLCKGVGYSILDGICRIGFDFLDLSSIYLKVFPNNERALSLYKRMGFKIQSIQNENAMLSLCKYKSNLVNII